VEAHHTSNPSTYLEVKRSKVEATRPINAHTVNAQYLPKGKAYELQTWQTDGQTKTCINDKRCDLQGQRSRSQGHVTRLKLLADKSRTKRPRNTKIDRKVAPSHRKYCAPVSRSKVKVIMVD